MYVGSWTIDALLTFVVNTHTASTGASADADSVPGYRVYEDETGTAILTGNMAKLDDANTTGFYSEQITLSAANGFEVGKSYTVYISALVATIPGTTSRNFQVVAAPLTAAAIRTEMDSNSLDLNAIQAAIVALNNLSAAQVDTLLSTTHGAGSWETGTPLGAGSVAWQIEITVSGVPQAGVDVWATTDLAGTNVIARATTDAFGLVVFMLDPGVYYIWKQLEGFSFTNPQATTVTP